jgi:hypothetical protein
MGNRFETPDRESCDDWRMRMLAMVLVLAACGGPAKKDERVPTGNTGGETKTLDEQMEEMRALLTDAAETMLAAEGCAGMAAAMNGWLEAHHGEVRASFDALATYPHEEVEARAEAMFGPDQPLSERLSSAHEACADDVDFGAAWGRMDEAFEPPWDSEDEGE